MLRRKNPLIIFAPSVAENRAKCEKIVTHYTMYFQLTLMAILLGSCSGFNATKPLKDHVDDCSTYKYNENACKSATYGDLNDSCQWCADKSIDGTVEDAGCFGFSNTPVGWDCDGFFAKKPATTKEVKATTCAAITTESTCMASMDGGEACSWCSSGAVGSSCQKESEAKALPSSVFECEYQTAYAAYAA